MEWESFSITGESFHFGRHGAGQEECSVVFPSDSLFAALVYCASLIKDQEAFESWILPFQNGDPPFLLTSVFPRAGKLRFFPMPMLRGKGTKRSDIPVKQLKKVAFVSESLFLRLLGGSDPQNVYKEAKLLQYGSVLVSAEEFEELPALLKKEGILWQLEKRPRVTLDRVSSSSAIYFTGGVRFMSDCGLWFAVTYRSGEKIDPLLAELAVQGLGGERSAGMGCCRIVNTGGIQLPDAGAGQWVNLGRYLPAEDEVTEVFSAGAAYHIENVGGWLNSPGIKAERRKSINLIGEGAVLNTAGKAVYGMMTDVQPDYAGTRPVGHAIWRSGFTVPVGLANIQGRQE